MAIAIALIGVLAATAALFLRGPLAAQAQSQRQAELNDQASLAAEIMRRELTAAGPGPVIRLVIPGGFDIVAGAVRFRCLPDSANPVSGEWRRIEGGMERVLTRFVAYCHAEDPTTGGYAGTAGRDQRVSFAWVLCDRPRCEDGARADVWQTVRVLP